MRANQILDGFSETLMQDDRILSSSEKELLTTLLQNAGTASGGNPEIQTAVIAAIHRSVGETVAQRAFGLLGGSIVDQILAAGSSRTDGIFAHTQPPGQPPGPQPPSAPVPPGVVRPPVKPTTVPPSPVKQPPKEQPMGPQPPSVNPPGPQGSQPLTVDARGNSEQRRTERAHGVEVLDAPENVRAQCVVLDEFLAPQEVAELMRHTLQHESDFRLSEVLSPTGNGDMVDYSHRRSRVLMDLGKHHEVIVKRIRGVLPQVLEQLHMEEFPVSWVETQITASNDGDFFHMHSDDGQDSIASRKLTFVYFFHEEPAQFHGGELRLHDANLRDERYVGADSYQTIVPRQNQIVFFPCSQPHEITAVECPSQAFAGSRFTVNGWLRT